MVSLFEYIGKTKFKLLGTSSKNFTAICVCFVLSTARVTGARLAGEERKKEEEEEEE